jgi:hypothetical protein
VATHQFSSAALASWGWMTADEVIAACMLLMLLVVGVWAHSRSK